MSGVTIKLEGSTLLQASAARRDAGAGWMGPQLITSLLRLVRVCEMFGPQHAQTRQGTEELVSRLATLHTQLGEETLTLLFTDHNTFLNGQALRLDAQSYTRSAALRAPLHACDYNVLRLRAGVEAAELGALLIALRDGPDALSSLALTHVELGAEQSGAGGDAAQQADERLAQINLYAMTMVRCAEYFAELRQRPTASARHVKRCIQQMSEALALHRHVFLGIIAMRLLPSEDFVHAVHAAIYAMFMAHELGLDRADVVRVGMTAITQDIHRVAGVAAEAHGDPGALDALDARFTANLSSVTVLSQMGVTDVLSALRLVTGYEQGFPHTHALPAQWYQEQRRPHLLTRIIELAKHYDLFVQGLPDQPGLAPDMALQSIMMRAGAYYDPDLARIFINVLGVYPVGSMVTLSTGERALVVRSPAVGESTSGQAIAHLPTVRLQGSGRLLDLAQPQHASVRITSLLSAEASRAEHPGAFAFF